jgi:DNA repair protein RecN (Recombination protein N)
VLTGETGAGKSILLDALSLALGSRGETALVRAGAQRGQVTATFEPPSDHPVHTLLAENGIAPDSAVILRRSQALDGKTRAFVNDQPCSMSLLREIGATLVEIHGQHDERALVSGDKHRRLLDAFGRLEPMPPMLPPATGRSASWRRKRRGYGPGWKTPPGKLIICGPR